MSKVCQVTGKKPSTGHNVSHSVRRTKRRFLPNLKKKRMFNPLTGEFEMLKVSTRGMRNLMKNPKKWFAKIGK